MITLPYAKDMVQAVFSRKANRFTAEVIVQGSVREAHIPSSGRMVELLLEGAHCLLTPVAPSLTRKTKYTLSAVKTGQTWVSVDSTLPNRLMRQALSKRLVPELSDHRLAQAEYTIGHSRFDFLLTRGARNTLVEVKSVTYVESGGAMFPDAPTARGRRHIKELMELCLEGYNAVVFFVAQRSDAQWLSAYVNIDPEFAAILATAQRSGVRILAYNCNVDENSVRLNAVIPVRL